MSLLKSLNLQFDQHCLFFYFQYVDDPHMWQYGIHMVVYNNILFVWSKSEDNLGPEILRPPLSKFISNRDRISYFTLVFKQYLYTYILSCVNNEGNCTSLTALRWSTLRWIGIVDFMMINRVRLKLDKIEQELGPRVSGRGCVA